MLLIPPRRWSWHDLGPIDFLYRGMMGLCFLCILAWLGSVGFFFSSLEKPEPELRAETRFFRCSLVYSGVYVLCFPILIYNVLFLRQFTLLLHFIFIVCAIYILYFVSRSLAKNETGRPPTFSEHAKYFLFLWFFFGGVWVVQPKVNELYAKNSSTEGPSTLTQTSPD